ncbi:MAG: malectin domain-containing carbohydrate-binding protein [Candidatus Brocadiia bacterium]
MADTLYRVNCGSSESVRDDHGRAWRADRAWKEGDDWGAIGGTEVTREPDLPLHPDGMAEVLRAERYGLDGYRFVVGPGTYDVRLHFAETFEGGDGPSRRFDIAVNGEEARTDFCPYTAGGGFARQAVVEVKGCPAPDGQISICFAGDGALVNAVEVLPGEEGPRRVAVHSPAAASGEPNAEVSPAGRERVRLLFIGNSGTFYWHVPETVAALVNSGQDRLFLETGSSTSGGKLLEYHYEETNARDLIRSGDYDCVVLQEASRGPLQETGSMLHYGARFIQEVREADAEPILYAYQGPEATSFEERERTMEPYVKLSDEYDVPLVPVAAALNRAMKERPDINYHNPDRHHMGMHGGYLIACCFYYILTGESPEGHPYPAVLGNEVRIEAPTARYLERLCHEVCRGYRTSRYAGT